MIVSMVHISVKAIRLPACTMPDRISISAMKLPKGGKPSSAKMPTANSSAREGQHADHAAEGLDLVGAVHRAQAAGREKQQGLNERVAHDVEQHAVRGRLADRQADGDDAGRTDAGVGDQPLVVARGHHLHGRDGQRQAAHDQQLVRDEVGVLAAEHLQHAKHRHHADVELHGGQQRAGAGGRGLVGLGHPAVQRRQAELAAQAEQHQRQPQPLPAVAGRGDALGHLVEREADLQAVQVRRSGQAHDAQEGQRQRHAGVQQVVPGHAARRGRVALRHQRRGAQRGQLDEGPQQQQVVGHHAQVHADHEGQRQRRRAAAGCSPAACEVLTREDM